MMLARVSKDALKSLDRASLESRIAQIDLDKSDFSGAKETQTVRIPSTQRRVGPFEAGESS